jgi:hypothetical protein
MKFLLIKGLYGSENPLSLVYKAENNYVFHARWQSPTPPIKIDSLWKYYVAKSLQSKYFFLYFLSPKHEIFTYKRSLWF